MCAHTDKHNTVKIFTTQHVCVQAFHEQCVNWCWLTYKFVTKLACEKVPGAISASREP